METGKNSRYFWNKCWDFYQIISLKNDILTKIDRLARTFSDHFYLIVNTLDPFQWLYVPCLSEVNKTLQRNQKFETHTSINKTKKITFSFKSMGK